MKIVVNKFHVTFITFLLLPPSAVDSRGPRRRGRPFRRSRGRHGYESDFNEFMEKMYSILPQRVVNNTPVNEQKSGPNVGYYPYWLGQEFPNDKQPLNDYGMDNSGKALWTHANESMIGEKALLGQGGAAGELSDEEAKSCGYNYGPDCKLGDSASELTAEEMAEYLQRTAKCDYLCTNEKRSIGLVCAADEARTFYQEMDLCVMEKANCLQGIAVVQATGRTDDWRRVPFVFKQGFGRVSVIGTGEAHFYFHNEFPAHWGRRYWMILDGWRTMRRSAIFCDNNPIPCWLKFPWFPDFARAVKGWEWMEYTIRWNKQTGYFLMSQARVPHWWDVFYVEYFDPWPWDIKYLDVTSRAKFKPRFIIHDLPYDLVLVNEGRCHKGPRPVEIGTREVIATANRHANAYFKRVKGITQLVDDGGPYVEYPDKTENT